MYDYNSEIQTGFPQLDKDYWEINNNNSTKKQDPLIEKNTTKSLEEISVFFNK